MESEVVGVKERWFKICGSGWGGREMVGVDSEVVWVERGMIQDLWQTC